MWDSYSNLPIAVVMLQSGKILVSLVNIDSVSEQDGNSLVLITGLQSCLGFSSKKAFA